MLHHESMPLETLLDRVEERKESKVRDTNKNKTRSFAIDGPFLFQMMGFQGMGETCLYRDQKSIDMQLVGDMRLLSLNMDVESDGRRIEMDA